jgi:hypothetical protein
MSQPIPPTQLVFEDVMVGGPPPLQLELTTVPLSQIELDLENPRLRYARTVVGHDVTPADIMFDTDSAMGDETRKLKEDIKKNGLFERPFVRRKRDELTGTVSYVAFEGNRRIACFNQLHSEDPSNPQWQSVPVRVLPDHTSELQLALMLGQFHVAGKLKWNAHERAGHVYRMSEDLKMPIDDIKVCLHMGKPAIEKAVAAYKMMMKVFVAVDNGRYARDADGKWSYFDEFYKQPDLKAQLKSDPLFAQDYCRWVGSGRLPNAMDVRRLPAVMKHGIAYRAFTTTDISERSDAAWNAAVNALEISDVSQKSDFFKKLKALIASAKTATMGDVHDAKKPAGRELIREARDRLDGIMRQGEIAV